MATAQQVRSQTKQGQWSSIFPNEQVTETQSTLFVKKLLAVAVSSISYLRALFPENAFGDRCLEDVNLKILRDDNNCPEACRVIQWIRGCFDALEKKYLRAVLVGIYEDPEDPDTVIEQYTFKFAYGDGNGIDIYRNGAKISSAKSDKETKKATVRLLRTIVFLSQTLSPLPDDVMMTMKLVYYDEITPEDYNPPGFKECATDEFAFKEEPMNIKVGDVATPFHAFKLRIKSLNHDLQQDEQDEKVDAEDENEEETTIGEEMETRANESESAVVPDTEENDEQPASEITMYHDDASTVVDKENHNPKENIEPDEKEAANETKVPNSVDTAYSGPSNTRVSTPASSAVIDEMSEDIVVKCCCEANEDDGLMILCASCNTWQHATCYAILAPPEAPEVHHCIVCSKENNYDCTDHYLTSFSNDKELKNYCIWRRALFSVTETTRILGPNLAKRIGVPTTEANKILKRMESEGFITAGGKAKRFGKLVQKEEILERGFNKYFRNCLQEQDEEMMNLMTEKASHLHLTGVKHKKDSSKKGLKRKSGEVFSAKNEDLRFEISNSQQDSQTVEDFNTKKRRKTSISVEPMAV
ncbi:HORMA domain-containing protein 1-like [Clytia hemisphaerica]|uniref:HORMA domain-containing protein n=1 Tax=Clytia hemisphaerica TaxID=252671 RepID=A0A7M6DNC8_9CNID